MAAFGERIESMRNGESQKAFAKSLGIPINTYTNWVRGIREPSMNAIITICTHLDVSADWLLGLPDRGVSTTTITGNAGSIAIGQGAKAHCTRLAPDCTRCKYKVFAEAFKAIQTPS